MTASTRSAASRWAPGSPTCAPSSEFLDLKRVSKPANFGEVQSRVNYNLGHFSSNYAVVFVMLSIYSLLTNFLLLFVIIFVTASLWGIGKLDGRDLDVGFRRFNTSQLYTGLLCIGVPLGIWASPIATVLWLIGATGVTVFGHAAFMDKPIENAFFRGGGLGGRPRAPYDMPRWGRPPGARKGRHNGGGGQYEEQMARVEEVQTDEDEYGRQLVRNGRAAYMRQLEYGGRGPRRRQDYDELTDDGESVVDGGDYDLYDHEDSTVAYAVQLAMRDKEDQLVDKALERIRRAQMLGKKNVRLSQRELDALERRRQQTDKPREARWPQPTGSASTTRPSSRRKSGGLPERPSGPPAGPYAPFAYGADAGWHPGAGAAGRPTSSSSANRPRTPHDAVTPPTAVQLSASTGLSCLS